MCLTCWNKISAQDQCAYLAGFYGHGDPNAQWIFVSLEEAGSSCSVYERFKYWDTNTRPYQLDGALKEDYLINLGVASADIYGMKGAPAQQNYLRGVEKIVEETEHQPPNLSKAKLDSIRQTRTGRIYDNRKIPTGVNSISILEMYPLPHGNVKQFAYAGMIGNSNQFKSRGQYQSYCHSLRYNWILTHLLNRLNSSSSARVVILGMSDPAFHSLFLDLVRGNAALCSASISTHKWGTSPNPVRVVNTTNGHRQQIVIAHFPHPNARGLTTADRTKLCNAIR